MGPIRIRVLVQVAGGSRQKKIYDEKTLEYRETQQTSLPYPYPYGFIIGTNAEAGDCVDCFLITRDQLTSGTVVECEPVGLLWQEEDGEIDHKVLAILPGQVSVLGQELLREFHEFMFTIFARHPEIKLKVGPILSREEALHHLEKSRFEYQRWNAI
jgi:inorganic pyrophosphatase